MLQRVSARPGEAASFPSRQLESEKSSTVQTDSDDNEWFKNAARALLGSDPGFALHVLTGVSESSGYRYASGERQYSGPVLRQLQRSPQGWQWLCALMEGCEEEWWIDLQRHKRMGEAADRARD